MHIWAFSDCFWRRFLMLMYFDLLVKSLFILYGIWWSKLKSQEVKKGFLPLWWNSSPFISQHLSLRWSSIKKVRVHCSKAVQRKWCQLKLLCDHHLIEQQPIYLLCTILGCTKKNLSSPSACRQAELLRTEIRRQCSGNGAN